MTTISKLSIIIPVSNQANTIAALTAEFRPVLAYLRGHYDTDVVFINDGSSDDSEALLKAAFVGDVKVRVVSHDESQGIGAALRTGFYHANGDLLVTTTFDGRYPFATIPQILARLKVEHCDVVTASPYHPNGHIDGAPGYRTWIDAGMAQVYRALVNRKIHTWTAPFRAYTRKAIDNISFEADDEMALTEILVKALEAGLPVCEFATTLHHPQAMTHNHVMSHLHLQWDMLKMRLGGDGQKAHAPLVKSTPH